MKDRTLQAQRIAVEVAAVVTAPGGRCPGAVIGKGVTGVYRLTIVDQRTGTALYHADDHSLLDLLEKLARYVGEMRHLRQTWPVPETTEGGA